MAPLNAKEVNQKTLQFILLFSAAVVVLVFAFYFNMRLPVMENKVLRGELESSGLLDKNQERIHSLILSINSSLTNKLNYRDEDSIDDINKRVEYLSSIHSKRDSLIMTSIYLSYKQRLKDIQNINARIDTIKSIRIDLRNKRNLNDRILEKTKNCLSNEDYNELIQQNEPKDSN